MGALGRLLLAEGEAEIADVRARILSAFDEAGITSPGLSSASITAAADEPSNPD